MQRLARVMAFLALVVHAGICYAQGPPDRRALVNEILNRSRLLEDAYFRIPRSVWHQFVIDESKGPDPAPVSHICSRGVYRIQADAKGAAGLDAEIRLLVLDARSAGSINVLPAPIAWSKTTLNGAPLLMAPKGKWLVFTPVKPGLYVIRARAAIKGFKSFGGSREAPIIRTVQTEVTLDSPSDLEVTVTGAASVGRGKKVAFALKPTSKLALIYRPLRHRTERQATYKVSGAVAWNFGPAAQQVSADLRVAIIGGKTESMSISVPSGAKRVAVSGPDVRDVRISGGSVTVFFRGSISGRTNLKVDYELPAAKGVADLGRPEISSGRWSGGTLVITNTAGGSEIQPTDMSGLKELALGDIPKVASAILAGKAVWAYSITSGSWSARAESINLGEFAIKQTLADSARYQFAYRPDGSVICRADYEIRNRNRQFLRITLPVGAKVMLARVSEKSRPMTPQLGKKGEYLLPLERSTASVMGLVSFPVQLVYIYRSAPLKGARRGQVALPRIDIPIAYAWCQGHMPAEMGRAKYSGVMTPVEQYSSQTALASMTYGSATALDPKRQRLGLPQALKPAPKPGGGGGGGGGGGLFGWMFSGKSNDLAQPMVAPVKPVTTQPSGGSSSWGFSGGISTGSLTRNYWRAGKDSYEKGNYDQAAESLGKVVEIAPDSPDAPNARRLLANIKLMQGKLKAKGRAEKAAAVTVKQQISAGNAIQIEQQNVLLEEGAEAAKKGDKKLAQQKFQAAEALSQTLVAKGESITDQRARLRGAQKQLEVARRSSSEELIKGVKKLKELRQSGRIAEAGRLADQLAGNVRVLSNDGTLEVTKDFQEQREQLALESAQNRLKDKTSGGDRILVGGGLSGEQINLGGVRPNANDQKWSGRFLDNSKVVAPEAKKTVQVYKVGDLVAADITNQVNANSAALLDIDKLETQRGKRTEDLTRQINTLVKNGKVNVTLRDGQRALQVTGDYNEQHAVAALIAGLRRARGPQVQVGANIALQEGLGQTGGADYGGHNRPDASNSGAMLDIANGTNAKPRSVRASIGHQTITTNGGTVVIQPGQDDQVDPDLQKFIDNNYRWQGKKAKPGEQGEYSLGLGANAWEMENKKHAERAKIQREKIQLQQAKASLINGDRVSSGEMASTINSSRAILRYRSTMQRSKELMGKGDNLKDLQDAHKLASAAHRMLLSVSDQSDSDEYRRMLNEAERQIYWINLNITKCRNELMLGEDPKNRPKGGNDSGLFDPGAGGGGDGDLDVMRSEIPWRTLVKYPKDWKEVTGKRKPFDARQQAAFDKSFGATVSKLDFEDMELNQVIQFLRDVSGLNIHVDWRALERENIKPQTTVTISAVDISFKQALESTLKKAGTENAPELDYVVDDGVITISTKANLGQKTIVRVYDVRDMVEKVPAFEGPRMGSELESRSEALNKIKTKITDSVTRDSWYDAGGETGAISEIGGQLVVTQTRENHQKTLEAINKLRKARGLKAAFGKDKEVDELWRMEADPTLRKQLDAIVSKIELEDEKFVEAIGFLRELSGINIYVKWRALALAKLDMGSSVNVQLTNVTIRKALETVLQSVVGKDRAELDYIIDDGVLMISTKDDLELRTRIGVYDVRDIALSIQAQDGEEKSRQESLMEIRTALTDTVDRDSWREAGGETGAISEHGGQFVITHTQSGHAKILSLLNTLRSGAGLRGPVRRLWVDPTEAKVDPAVKKLLDTEVSKLDFEDMEIVQVFQFLRDVSGANIHVNWRALALESIEPATTVNVHLKKITFRKALEIVLEDAASGGEPGVGVTGLGYIVEDGVIRVSTKAALSAKMIVCIYDIRDMIQAAMGAESDLEYRDEISAEIRTLIADTVSRDTWREAGGETGMISELAGQLVITQTHDTHAAICALLNTMRKAGGMKGTVKWLRVEQTAQPPRNKTDLDKSTIARVYDISELVTIGSGRDGGFQSLEGAADDLNDLIRVTVDLDSWRHTGGKIGRMKTTASQCLVTQTMRNHAKIVALLNTLRQAGELEGPVTWTGQDNTPDAAPKPKPVQTNTRAGLDAAELARKLRFNRGQKTQIASLNLNVDAATAGSLGVKFRKGNNDVSYTTIDEAQFRTLMEIDAAAKANAQGAEVGANETRQDTIIGTDALLANAMTTNVTYSYDKGNTLDVNDNPISVSHDKYVLVDNGGYLTAVRAGQMQHWSQASKNIEFVKAPQTIEIPRVGVMVKLEKTLVKPSDEMIVRFDY